MRYDISLSKCFTDSFRVLLNLLFQAINFLHECGVLLHYNDVQTKLSDLYFLDPEWLCMLMGQIITVKQINAFISKDGVSSLGN